MLADIIASFLHVCTGPTHYRQLLAGHGYYSACGLSGGRFPTVAVSMWNCFTMYSGAVVVQTGFNAQGDRIVLLHAAYNTMSQKHGLQCHVSMVELSITIGNQWMINCHWPGRINKVSKHVASMDDCNNACVPVWVLDPVNHQNTDWERLWSKAAARTITKLQVGGSWSWERNTGGEKVFHKV